jgi:hypothetical protein
MKKFVLVSKNGSWELHIAGDTRPIDYFRSKEEALPQCQRLISKAGGGSLEIRERSFK